MGPIDTVRLLIRKGANVNASNNDGWNSLHFCVTGYQFEIAKILIESGVELGAKTRNGYTAEMMAAEETYGNGSVLDDKQQKAIDDIVNLIQKFSN